MKVSSYEIVRIYRVFMYIEEWKERSFNLCIYKYISIYLSIYRGERCAHSDQSIDSPLQRINEVRWSASFFGLSVAE